MEESGDFISAAKGETDRELQACCYLHCQGNVQATLRPAIWTPCLRSPHVYKETWEVATNPAVCMHEVIQAVRILNTENHGGKLYELAKVQEETHFIQINLYSYAQWLSVIDFRFSQEEKASFTTAKVRAFCSGILPVTVPLSFIWNSLCCCIPFYDFGKNRKWLKTIREALPLNVTVISARRGC